VERLYKLEGKVAVPVSAEEVILWCMSREDHGSVAVGKDRFTDDEGEVFISTVFLMGINHQIRPGQEPLLFETMVFGGAMDESQWRYSTWVDAERGHQAVLAALFVLKPHFKPDYFTPPDPSIPTRFERIR
jgi:hypothetical protein